jgi:hypothetical protein
MVEMVKSYKEMPKKLMEMMEMVEMVENRVSFIEKLIEKIVFFKKKILKKRSLQYFLNHSVVSQWLERFIFMALTF